MTDEKNLEGQFSQFDMSSRSEDTGIPIPNVPGATGASSIGGESGSLEKQIEQAETQKEKVDFNQIGEKYLADLDVQRRKIIEEMTYNEQHKNQYFEWFITQSDLAQYNDLREKIDLKVKGVLTALGIKKKGTIDNKITEYRSKVGACTKTREKYALRVEELSKGREELVRQFAYVKNEKKQKIEAVAQKKIEADNLEKQLEENVRLYDAKKKTYDEYAGFVADSIEYGERLEVEIKGTQNNLKSLERQERDLQRRSNAVTNMYRIYSLFTKHLEVSEIELLGLIKELEFIRDGDKGGVEDLITRATEMGNILDEARAYATSVEGDVTKFADVAVRLIDRRSSNYPDLAPKSRFAKYWKTNPA